MPEKILLNLILKGKKGKRAPKGKKGFKGSKGYIGNIGEIGNQGTTGMTGVTGATGTNGNIGEIGPKGITGEAGATGPTGNSGHSTFTNNEFRLFELTKNTSGITKLTWPVEFNDVSNGISINNWSLICVGTHFNSSSIEYRFSQLSNLCYPDLIENAWYLKHIMIDRGADITNGSMNFHLLGIPRSICDDSRTIFVFNGTLGFYKTVFNNISPVSLTAPTSAFTPSTNGFSIYTSKSTYNLSSGNFVNISNSGSLNNKQYYISCKIYWTNTTQNILLRGNADDALTLKIRKSGTSSWTTLFDYWQQFPSHSVGATTYRFSTSQFLMEYNNVYEVVIACGNFLGYGQTRISYLPSPNWWVAGLKPIGVYDSLSIGESILLHNYSNQSGITMEFDPYVYQWDYYP